MQNRQEPSLKQKALDATIWSGLTQVSAKIIPPITNMILARLLTPEAFGIVATFTVLISFADVFTDAGFQKYIIQHEFESEDSLRKSTNVAFWTNFIFSLIIWLIIMLFSHPLSIWIGTPGCEKGIIVACLVIPITAFSSIQQAFLRRKFNFKAIFWVRLALSAIPLIITVPLACFFRNYWALVIGTVVRELVNSVFLTVLSSWKPRFEYSFVRLRRMFSFSAWTLLEQISIWLTTNIGIFIVGQFLNQYYLGLYKTSMSTVNAILMIVSSSVTPVLFSTLSRIQNRGEQFKETFYKFHRCLAILIIPMGVGIFVYRHLITLIMLGDQWGEAENFIGLWGLAYSLSIIFNSLNSEAIRSKGKPQLSLGIQCVQIVVTATSLIIAAPHGFQTLYVARTITPIASIIASSLVVSLCFGISQRRIIIGVLPIISSSIIMGVLGQFLKSVCEGIIWQLFSVLFCVIIYFIVLLIGFPHIRKELLGISYIERFVEKIKSMTIFRSR